jgi:hypothetical protein
VIEDDDDNLYDETWIDNKKKFWKNNISPLKIKDGNMTAKELQKLLVETFPRHYAK